MILVFLEQVIYKSFYEQVILQGSTRKPLNCRKRYSPTSRKARVFKAPPRRSYKIRRQRIFFPTSPLTQERKKIVPTKLSTRRVKDSPSIFFCLTSSSIQERKGLFIQRATYKGNGSTGKPRKPLSARADLSPQKWDVRKSRKEKKRKRPRKARRWLQRRQGSVCPKPRINFFWFTSIWV